jgi:dTDP-4-amino-4,6-dideoxygalactose transaminase
VNLQHLDADIAARLAIAARYREMIQPGVVRLPDAGGSVAGHAYHQFAVLVDDRDALQAHLKDRGIVAGILYPAPIHLQQAYQAIASRWWLDLAVSEHVCRHVLCLPMHPHLSAADIARVAAALNEFRAVSTEPRRRAA